MAGRRNPRPQASARPWWAALVAATLASACQRAAPSAAADAGPEAGSSVSTEAATAASSSSSAAASTGAPEAAPARADEPLLGITAFVATVYAEPRDTAKKLGYLRIGAKVRRSPAPMGFEGCPKGWYGIAPRGFVCAGKEATTDLDDPILRAASKRPNLKTALPYRYGFVRAVLPLYLRVPTAAEQFKSEFKLKEHLAWYEQNQAVVDQVRFGANDVPIDDRGVPVAGKRIGELGLGTNSLETPLGVLLGGETDSDPIPFWLEGGKRHIPNVSDFVVPEYAVFADRARRFTGLAFIGSFPTGPESLNRRFSITTDLRLAPTTKVKPDTGSAWHGVELNDELTLPLAFVRAPGARAYKIVKGRVVPAGEVEHRSVHALVGKMRTVEGVRYYRTKDRRWLSQMDVGLAVAPATWPEAAEKGEKWIEISIGNQTLVLWEGKKPVYATLVSTGKAGLDDPKKTTATVRGTFRIRNKHITATMDSNESSSVGGQPDTTAFTSIAPAAAVARRDDGDAPGAKKGAAASKGAAKGGTTKAGNAGKTSASSKTNAGAKPAPAKAGGSKKDAKPAKPSAAKAEKPAANGAKEPPPIPEDYVPRKGDGMYGVTRRRGEGKYVLRDVPYIQYFAQGYALHTAYWHDVFGTPRSHGCVNLSPIDGHRVFLWTEPKVPDGWHAINTGEELGQGTVVVVHE